VATLVEVLYPNISHASSGPKAIAIVTNAKAAISTRVSVLRRRDLVLCAARRSMTTACLGRRLTRSVVDSTPSNAKGDTAVVDEFDRLGR
jgi:hypothetical protein